MTTRRYRLRKDSSLNAGAKAGMIVLDGGYDYGLAADDTAITGVPHTSVKLPGVLAGFTIPIADLEDLPALAPPTSEETKTLCRVAEGDATCRYLTMSARGWGCEKLTTLRRVIDERVAAGTFNAKGDNCPGKGD